MDTPLLALTLRRSGHAGGRSPEAAAAENMRQLIQLRWIAVAGQVIAILVAHFGLGVRLPLLPMLAVAGALGGANLLFTLSLGRWPVVPGEFLFALALDMAALTAQLYFSGGATNPFIALYLLQVVLGAILLPLAMVAPMAGACCLAFAFLSVRHLPLNLPASVGGIGDLRLLGEWIAFVMVAVLLLLFITRISRNLRARETFVAELGQRAAEEDGIVRMGLFASGAAHELGTPLSSLSVLVADWQRDPRLAADPALREELAEAQAEIGRCKEIVSNILHSAGQARGEAMGAAEVSALLDEIAAEWSAVHPSIPFDYHLADLQDVRVAAEPALRQAIWNLLENAGEASPGSVMLEGSRLDDWLVIAVSDAGPGFSGPQLAGIGKLYQSSKGPGHGLGLFLTVNVVRRLGGRLEAENRAAGGAVVRLLLPMLPAASQKEL
ncbi:ATP-binding protein [Parafrankia sp. BMG5.11]|uniref:ATP-binding protein n=1 Tax=Parafrankia sp. BMG5.11 TaxID=222540 RepID=UPI001A9F5A08|nr:ATP-binding protein [Parafrankia sp. BMG5.11]